MVMTTSQLKHADRRESARVCLELKLVVVYPQREDLPARPMFHGKTHDIGMSGLSIVVDYNVFDEDEIALVLALPPSGAEVSHKAVTCTAKMTYGIHSSKLDAYKIGLTFREFRGRGKELLDTALRQALKEVGGAGMQDPRARSRVNRPSDSQPLGC